MLHRTIAMTSVAVVLACAAVLQAETSAATERFTFTVPNAPPDALNKEGRFRLTINRWSTDKERELIAGGAAEPAKLLGGFRDIGNIGYLQWPGGLEYAVRYARRTPRPDGGADIVVVADRPLWVWWDTNVKWSTDRPFTVLHLRVDKNGAGDGRASVATGIKADKEAGVTLADLNGPPLIAQVRRESVS